MSQFQKFPSFKALLSYFREFQRELLNASIQVLLGSVPVVGAQLAENKRLEIYLQTLFESEDEIQSDIQKVSSYMVELEEIMARLNIRIERRTNDLKRTLEEYERYKELASVEREKVLPLLKEISREGNKGIKWGLITNLMMVILGIILAHFLRIWFPDFAF